MKTSSGSMPVQITLRGMAHSEPLMGLIRQQAEKLARLHQQLATCRVTVEVEGRHKEHGSQVAVHIDLKVPGEEIAVTHKHAEDASLAVREAFAAAFRSLEEHLRRRREARRSQSAPAA